MSKVPLYLPPSVGWNEISTPIFLCAGRVTSLQLHATTKGPVVEPMLICRSAFPLFLTVMYLDSADRFFKSSFPKLTSFGVTERMPTRDCALGAAS